MKNLAENKDILELGKHGENIYIMMFFQGNTF